jgi:sugar phosphate isomerase/epimerase
MNRRSFISTLGAGAAVALASTTMPKLSIFSKHLQFLEGAELADAIVEIGVPSVDLALRKGGHIEPSRVKQDLPPLLKIFAERNLQLAMATTDIVDAESPFAESVLETLADHGVHHYRWGGFKFDPSTSVVDQIESLKPRVAKLAELNRKHGMCAMYHTHSGLNQIGAAIWDLHLLLKDFDPRSVAVNYDIGHATVEGGFGGWIESLNVTGRYLRGVALKDVYWKKSADGQWRSQWCPIGEGMVHFEEFFATLRRVNFEGPMQVHYEYPLGGAESGKREIHISKAEVIAAMKRDVTKLHGLWKA